MFECTRVGVPPHQIFLIGFAKIPWGNLETSGGGVVIPKLPRGLAPGYYEL